MRTATIFILFSLGACSLRQAPDGGTLSDQIGEQLKQGDGTTVDLAALAPFAWTRFCAFEPYTTEERAEEALGFNWRYRWSAVEDLDDRNYLVFLDGSEVVAAFDHTLDLGNFAELDSVCYARDEARFTVSEQGRLVGGAPHYVLQAVP